MSSYVNTSELQIPRVLLSETSNPGHPGALGLCPAITLLVMLQM